MRLALTTTLAVSMLAKAVFAAPFIQQKSGAWWGDVANPNANQVWMQVDDVVPDATVAGVISFRVTCTLPTPTTMRLTGMVVQVDGVNGPAYYGSRAAALLGKTTTMSVDTRKFDDGWHELRARCYAAETAPTAERGKETQVTNGHQLYFKNGNRLMDSHLVTPGIVDSHAWYDTDALTGDSIRYVYVQLQNVHSLIDAPLRGIVPVSGRVTNAGSTTLDHWAIKIDGQLLVEFHGSTQYRTYNLDTTKLSNGTHTLQMHGHALGRSGKQVAGEVRIPIVVQN